MSTKAQLEIKLQELDVEAKRIDDFLASPEHKVFEDALPVLRNAARQGHLPIGVVERLEGLHWLLRQKALKGE